MTPTSVIPVTEVAALLGELTGRRLPQRTAPDWVLQPGSRLADRAQRLLPVRLPVSAEQVALPISLPAGVVVDDTATRQELAIERRKLRETLPDTVCWLAIRGLVTARQAGALAGLTRPRSDRGRGRATAAAGPPCPTGPAQAHRQVCGSHPAVDLATARAGQA